jgi:hypothetical protein
MTQITFKHTNTTQKIVSLVEDSGNFISVRDNDDNPLLMEAATPSSDSNNTNLVVTRGYINNISDDFVSQDDFDNKLVNLFNDYTYVDPVRGVANGNIADISDLTSYTSNGVLTINEVEYVADDRILLESQTDKVENGVYVVIESQGAFTLARPSSQDSVEATGVQVRSFHLLVESLNAYFVVTSDSLGDGSAIGVSEIEFQEFALLTNVPQNGLQHGDNYKILKIDENYLNFTTIETTDGDGNSSQENKLTVTAPNFEAEKTTVSELTIESDKTIKNSIEELSAEETHQKVLQLQGVTYKLNKEDDDRQHIGFIAQEVEQVFPEFVKQGDIKSVNYSQMVAVLLESIKHQNNVIKTLEERIKALE